MSHPDDLAGLTPVTLSRCRCGVTFPRIVGADLPTACRGCRDHDLHSLNRVDPSSPSYQLACTVTTYLAALQLTSQILNRALHGEGLGVRVLVRAVQEALDVTDAALFGLVHIDPPEQPSTTAGLIPQPRAADSAGAAAEEARHG